MQSEGISRQTHGHAVICRHVDRRRARRADPLHGHCSGVSVISCSRAFFMTASTSSWSVCVRIGAAHHRDVPQIILKRIIAQLRRNDLKSAVDARR